MTLSYFLRQAVLLVLLGLGILVAQAQPDPVKFGQVTAADFNAAQYPVAAGAPAVVLCDYGRTRIEGAHDGFKVAFERVTRVLILSKAGYEQATVQVPLYRFEGQEDELLNLRGATYNLVGGKLEKQKLTGDAVFKEQASREAAVRKFTLPGVREGSIIEYAYTVKSWRLFKLYPWQFQHPDVPVVWSEYRTVVPSFYQYKELPRGYLPYAMRTQAVVPYSTNYNVSHQDDYGTTADVNPSRRLVGDALGSRWVMRDVPAFRPEAYMTTPHDYLAAVEFELHQTAFDPARPKPVTSTWAKIADELLKEEAFGGLLERRDLAGEFSNASPLTAQATALTSNSDANARMAGALALVRGALRYNDEEWLYARTPRLRQLVEQHQGNAAELNLLLVHTLRDAGLTAYPVLLSTRSHGRIQTEIPVLSQFNYVVACVVLPGSGKEVLLDATDPLTPPGVLPERCLNGQGRLIDADGGRWVALTPTQRHSQFTNARLTLSPQGELQGNVRVEYGGYAGLQERAQLAAQGEKKFLTQWPAQRPDWQVVRAAVQRATEPATPLLLDMDLRLPAAPAQAMYLPLLQLLATTDNPFLPETRLYPVDLGAPHEYTTTVLLTLPAGYQASALPAPLRLELPGGAGQFVFDASQQGPLLQLSSRLVLAHPSYAPAEYTALRELVTRAVAKHREPLVLQRTP